MLLTRRQREILTKMRDEDEELVYEYGRAAYLGYDPVSPRTVLVLLSMAAISLDRFSTVGKFERYMINETGRALLSQSGGDS